MALPIYVDLNQIDNISNEFIQSYLMTHYNLNQIQIDDAKSNKNIIWIFDHYGDKGQLANLFVSQHLQDWQGKSIIISDLIHLNKFNNYQPCFAPYIKSKKQSNMLKVIYLKLDENNAFTFYEENIEKKNVINSSTLFINRFLLKNE